MIYYAFLIFVAYIIVATVVALAIKGENEKLEIVLKVISGFLIEIVYELGKGAFIAGLIGMYFIPESKDFAMAVKYGIIFYAVGYGLKK